MQNEDVSKHLTTIDQTRASDKGKWETRTRTRTKTKTLRDARMRIERNCGDEGQRTNMKDGHEWRVPEQRPMKRVTVHKLEDPGRQ
jgi:hypothetical protein